MSEHEEKLKEQLRLSRKHLFEAAELSKGYGIHDRLLEAVIRVEDAYTWFVQTHD